MAHRLAPSHPRAFFGAGGALARTLPEYEERPSQQQLAPAVELGRRVVVSTGTKNLQEQLILKDVPLLARALGRDLSVALMKGRGNYLCLMRYPSFGQAGNLPPPPGGPVF